MLEPVVHEHLMHGRARDARAEIERSLADVGVRLPNRRAAATAKLARTRASIRVRGYTMRRRDSGSEDRKEKLDRALAAANALALVDGLLADVIHSRYLLLALRAGDATHAARALALEAIFLSGFSGSARRRAEEVVERAADLAGTSGDHLAHGMVAAARGFVAASAGYFGEARRAWNRAEGSLAETNGGLLPRLRVRGWQQSTCFYLGDLPGLERTVDDSTCATHYSAMVAQTGVGNMAWLIHDDVDGARQVLAQGETDGSYIPEMSLRLAQAGAHIDLYTGDPADAWRRVNRAWPELADHRVLRAQRLRIEAHHLRARCALAAAAAGRDRTARLDDAEHDIAELERERMPWSTALSRLLRAGLLNQKGDTHGARAWLRAACADLERRELALHLAAAHRHHGILAGGAAGDDEAARADHWLRNRGVAAPDRLCAVLAPGL